MKYYKFRIFAVIFSVFLFFSSNSNASLDNKDFTNSVALQGLNKITARTSALKAQLGEVSDFGNLEIILKKCWKSPPEEQPESKALLQIFEQIPDEEKKQIFYGWMFESSPAISALEHPVYDIRVISCENIEEKEDDDNR